MKKILLIIGLVLIPCVSEGQTAPTSYQVRYYSVGAQAPIQFQVLLPANFVCNSTPINSTIIANPNKIVWDDPTASGKVCIYTESPGGTLVSFPVGNYDATLTAINNIGESPESVRAPFVRGDTPGVPTNVQFVR